MDQLSTIYHSKISSIPSIPAFNKRARTQDIEQSKEFIVRQLSTTKVWTTITDDRIRQKFLSTMNGLSTIQSL